MLPKRSSSQRQWDNHGGRFGLSRRKKNESCEVCSINSGMHADPASERGREGASEREREREREARREQAYQQEREKKKSDKSKKGKVRTRNQTLEWVGKSVVVVVVVGQRATQVFVHNHVSAFNHVPLLIAS